MTMPPTDPRHRHQAASQPAAVRLRRVQHPGRAVAFVSVVLLMLVASFAAGALLVAPQGAAIDNASTRVDPVLFVEERVVADEVHLSAGVVAGASFDIVRGPEHLANADQSVVGAVHAQPGDTIGYGIVVAEVSGRPVVTVPSTTPLFRDLRAGAYGSDVRALQEMLVGLDYRGVSISGVLDEGTLDALGRLYRGNGYELASEGDAPVIRWREFARIPTDRGTVVRTADVGTVLDSETPLMTVQTAAPTVVAFATLVQADRFRVGMDVSVSAGGGAPVSSTVLAIGDFATDPATGVGGKQVSVALPTSLADTAGQPLTVRSAIEAPAALAVPLLAVQTDAEGPFVRAYRTLQERAADAEGSAETQAAALAERRIGIEVSAQAGGWVAVGADDRLHAGMRLELPR